MRWIYISPHFDDAVLSCGGLIWEQTHSGIPVEIWTVNAGDPPPGPPSDLITRVHASWKTGTPQETVVQRRLEDQNAAHVVGATVRHLNLVDAIYRRNLAGELIYTRDVFDPIHPDDNDMVSQTALQISDYLYEADTVVCPLALGNHVDHIITRQAVESLRKPRSGAAIYYYADIPYLFKHEDELAPATLGLTFENFFISERGMAAWMDGIEAHESQLASLFENSESMRTQIKAYAVSKCGQNIWKRVYG